MPHKRRMLATFNSHYDDLKKSDRLQTLPVVDVDTHPLAVERPPQIYTEVPAQQAQTLISVIFLF